MAGLPFPISEFRSRLTKIKETMDEVSVDVFITHTPENIYYLSGYETPGYYMYQALIIPRDEDPIFIVRLLEESNVKGLSWIKNSVTYADSEDPIEVTAKTISDAGFDNKKIGIEKDCWFFTPLQFEKLRALLPKATIKDCGGIVEKHRLIKSEREIGYIKRAARVVEKGMEAGLAAIEVGKTENEIAAEVLKALIIAGSEYQGLPPFIASGYRSALAHATWAGRKIKRGDLVFFELPACVRRYHAALMRTTVVGKPKKKYEKVAEVICNALENAINTIKPGVTAGEVDRACRGVITKAGYGHLYPHRCGYSIGIAFPPDWGEGDILSLRAGETTVLKPNMTFHMPPIVFFYGEGAIGFSETVRVTENGCEVITNFERKLFVK